jgi:hypothetical protein
VEPVLRARSSSRWIQLHAHAAADASSGGHGHEHGGGGAARSGDKAAARILLLPAAVTTLSRYALSSSLPSRWGAKRSAPLARSLQLD